MEEKTMGITLSNNESIEALNKVQVNLHHSDMISSGVYMCDCTGCSNACFESCADGNGPTN